MAQFLFTFTIDPETKEAAWVGNIEPQVALQFLQQIVILEAVKKQKEEKAKTETSSEKPQVPESA